MDSIEQIEEISKIYNYVIMILYHLGLFWQKWFGLLIEEVPTKLDIIKYT